jgi:hypothetical protein
MRRPASVGMGVTVGLGPDDSDVVADGDGPTEPGTDGEADDVASREQAARSRAATKGARRFRRTEG